MRLAICTLSAALLSGCSWLGMGGSEYSAGYSGQSAYGCETGGVYGGQYSQAQGACGVNGAAGYGDAYGAGQHAGYAYGAGQQAGYNGYTLSGFQGAYSPEAAGYGASGYGAGAGYGTGAGYGAYGGGTAGAYGLAANGGYGVGVGVDGVTGQPVALGTGAGGAYGATGYGTAGYGATAYGATSYGTGYSQTGVAGGQYTQYLGGQVAGGNVQTVTGAPIYVPQPYPSYYQAPRLRVGGAAQPMGLSGFGGVSNFNEGNLFAGEAAKPAGTDGRSVSALDAISYEQAFGEGKTYGGSVEYDIDRNNTAFLTASRTNYEGQSLVNGTITQDNTATGGAVFTDDGIYSFSDLEETALEAGLRHYVGNNSGLRPYVAGSAGFVHNNRVELTTSTVDTNVVAAPETQEYIREGWQPTASGMIGAEMAVGPNAALGVETGLRWTNARGTNLESEDSWSVPMQVRGRIAF